MKKITSFINIIITGLIFSSPAFAYNTNSGDEKCKPPKFKKFNPPAKTKDTAVPEVEPEAEISFIVSGYSDPTSIQVMAKDQKLDINVEDHNSFYLVMARLPAVLNGKYARINLIAVAQTGACTGKDGWLIKINNPEQ